MKNRWSDAEARAFADRYAAWGEDLALRVYTSRLIGSEPSLVMHGGGNTSVKSTWIDLFGQEVEAIFVKGSGWSLDAIEPPGLPGLDLAYLRRLRDIEELSDEEMVNQLRTHLFDASAPNPSVETLLHAFLRHKFIDHSHADAILLLTNQEDGEALVREALGDGVALVPYVMPGFALSRAAARVAEENPDCEGLVLLQHGLFTWGETARESYERHLELVDRAEAFLRRRSGRMLAPSRPVADPEPAKARAARAAPLVRGLLNRGPRSPGRWILDFRLDRAIEELVADDEGAALLATGPLTPDHVIRTKAQPLLLPALADDEEAWKRSAQEALDAYVAAYDRYFEENAALRDGEDLTRLDPLPRLVAISGLGVFAVGSTVAAAAIAGDIYQHTAEVKSASKALGPYRSLSEADLFDVEYWSLEQAKLGRAAPKPLAGRVALVTGAAGAIGSAITEALAREGAAVIGVDLDEEGLGRIAALVAEEGGSCHGVAADVASEADVAAAFESACLRFGGVDLVVLNAGIARSAPLDRLALDEWRRVLEVNLTGYFVTLREAARLFRRQASGGNVVVVASKNVFAPGAEFAAYSVSKSGGHQLGRLAAIELAPLGVRVNMVNPDAVFAHGEVASGLWREIGEERARARGLDPEDLADYYRERNLLKTRITGEDVARAVLFFAREETPTTGATLPVDGGIPEAFPR